MFSAMAAAWPCSSALTPGSAPGVSTRVTTGRPSRAARRISRSALRCPAGLAMPKLRATNSAVVCPFWWPMTITCRPAEPRHPAHDGRAVRAEPVAVQLHEPVEDRVQIVQCGRPPGVPRHPDGVPRVAYRRGAGVSLGRRVRRPRQDRAVVGEALAVRRRLLPGYGRTRRTAGAGRGEQRRQPSAQRPPLHHHVDLPVSQQEVGGLEALRQRPPGDLADHPRAGEAHPRAALGEHQVGVGGERGGHPAVGRVGEDAHGEQPRLAQRGDGLADGRHLHQRQRALLHPRPAGGGDQDERRCGRPAPVRRPG